ncbi:MAG: class I SAM-dependent methyltransferase [Helicobacteraceae bacterium]|jgi:tRNA (cmo5U34)-methyltransferase|nr:class I SAM-dependent methyltransferase [Helicobacteraceae bacterium]
MIDNLSKSTVEEIKNRFDNDVERFSNLETGQISTIDAKITLELITDTSLALVPNAQNLLDIGCGAGNYAITMLSKNKNLDCVLIDLSKPMLDRAFERVSAITDKVKTIQGDIRAVELPENRFDIILAGAVLHHLRDDEDWRNVFSKIYKMLKSDGCFAICDLVTQDCEITTRYMRERYGDYLRSVGGEEYRRKVFDYVEKEDSPRSINYQLDLMKKVGFTRVEILHKNICFAAFVGIK